MNLVERSVRYPFFTMYHAAVRLGLIDFNSYHFPDFLCIGAQKSGTTWLHRVLMGHPDIYLPPQKEVHYFNSHYRRHSLAWYSAQFETGRGKSCGDITPAYGVLDESKVRYMKTLMPRAKIILILRDPIDRAWSAANMHLCRIDGKAV